MSLIKNVCVDLDDTLAPDGYKYRLAALRAYVIMGEAMGTHCPLPSVLCERQIAHDRRLHGERGFYDKLFPDSLVATYEESCRERGLPIDRGVALKVWEAGWCYTHGPWFFFPEAEKGLRRLRTNGHCLHLVTQGAEWLQKSKIAALHLPRLFDSIAICPRKRPRLAEIIGDDPRCGVMIGNSLRSDIGAATELGMRSILIANVCNPWDEADIPTGLYSRAQDFFEAAELVISWSKE